MLVEKLPINEKEIQIPSKELNALQKNQYLKNIESTRNEIVTKIDACLEFKKAEFFQREKKKFIESINNGKLKKLLEKYNTVVNQRKKVMDEKIEPLSAEMRALYQQLKEAVSGNEFLKIPSESVDGYELQNLVYSYKLENEIGERFKKENAVFKNKKKLLQTHYKLMQDALLYYKVDKFKKLLMQFLMTRDEINKIYIPIIKNQAVSIDVSE